MIFLCLVNRNNDFTFCRKGVILRNVWSLIFENNNIREFRNYVSHISPENKWQQNISHPLILSQFNKRFGILVTVMRKK